MSKRPASISAKKKAEPSDILSGAPVGTPQVPLPMPQGALPPTFHAGHLVIGMGVGEINVLLGQTRLSPAPPQGTQNNATPFVEWFGTISLSAPIARQLVDGLTTALNEYEKAFGPIPKAPPPSASRIRNKQ